MKSTLDRREFILKNLHAAPNSACLTRLRCGGRLFNWNFRTQPRRLGDRTERARGLQVGRAVDAQPRRHRSR